MDSTTLRLYLDDPAAGAQWLAGCGLMDLDRAQADFQRIAELSLPLDLLANLATTLTQHLPKLSDADMALNNLERFLQSARSPLATAALFERDADSLPTLLQIFSTSQYLSDVLIRDAASYDLLRMTDGQPVDRQSLVDELVAEAALLADDLPAAMAVLRRFKRRETLRIAYGDIVRGHRLDVVTEQISHVADAIVEAAVQIAWKRALRRRSAPTYSNGERAKLVVLALGKLGGRELNYSSDIDLVFLYDIGPAADPGQQLAAGEFFDRLVQEIVKLLIEPTELGVAYRVDLLLRPNGHAGALVNRFGPALRYYDTLGRTWERQAYVKARPIAGDEELGEQFLGELQPWIFRRYLTRADISGIKALKRRIEHRSDRSGEDGFNVKTGRGGIRDIEFVIQFLQLLNGADLPKLRVGNTLEAIEKLERCGCLTAQERSHLEKNYGFLRKIEHRLQIMFDLQTHLIPASADEQRKLAIRLGYVDAPNLTALAAFLSDYRQATEVNRMVLDHLLHDAFNEEQQSEPECDLILDPQPLPERVQEVLGKYRFADVHQAYLNLMDLAQEKIRFLSTRRCRHFLAGIAAKLLSAIAATPDPDFTLINLGRVSDSLGGKGVLWELFSFHPPSLKLYVELCSSSEYLSGLLTTHPGMIDGLLDSLLLDKLPQLSDLRNMLIELCHGAEDIEPILHSYKNDQQLRVGVRDILGKDPVEAINGTLSDIAQAILETVTRQEYERLTGRFGVPMVVTEGEPPRVCQYTLLALGKLGGRELNYYSDLDLLFIYEADGLTQPPRKARFEPTTNQHFFTELGQRLIKVLNQLGPNGRLFEVDPRLRPGGKSGILATALPEFERYYGSDQAQLWERQALCKARPLTGTPEFQAAVWQQAQVARRLQPWQPQDALSIRQMRARIEATAPPGNFKSGPGGLMDIEFLVQTLQLRYGREQPEICQPATLASLTAIRAAKLLSDEDADYLIKSYRFLRKLQARLRLSSTVARDNLPEDPRQLHKLSSLLGYTAPEQLLEDCHFFATENRRLLDRLLDEALAAPLANEQAAEDR